MRGEMSAETYQIVKTTSSPEALTHQVNRLIEQGWEPQGGVAAWGGPMGGGCLFQAMVKRESR